MASQVSSLNKDMSSLKITEGGSGPRKAEEGSPKRSSNSARKELKELKRASSKRRSSKQGGTKIDQTLGRVDVKG